MQSVIYTYNAKLNVLSVAVLNIMTIFKYIIM